ncbi:MAG: GvpL/GvpF family gas vesicle protein, partial [Bacteroidota bacterium]
AKVPVSPTDGSTTAKGMEPDEKTLAPAVKLDPIKLEFPKISLKVDFPAPPPTSASEKEAPPKPTIPVKPIPQLKTPEKETPEPSPAQASKRERDLKELERLEEFAMKIEAEYAAKAKPVQPPAELGPTVIEDQPTVELTAETKEPASGMTRAPVEQDVFEEEENGSVIAESSGVGKRTARDRYNFADDDYVYVHAVSWIPESEEASREPFMLEEKGIDGRGFAFALDYEGMRFYLSKINPNEVNISKAMVLLLNKQESLQMQGSHESTLNDLRGHGVLLPFEFGTVARGKDYLLGIIDKNREDIEEALDDMVATDSWTVTASVLDSTIANIVGTDVHTVGRDRSRDRASYTSAAQTKKFDIKVLERILQREKKLAESVHAELVAVAERADIQTMVGLGSGSSEDWKVILKASYEVDGRDIGRFNRAVTDLQYHHLQYDLMMAVTGKRDYYTMRKK